ncbi:MAG: hypothetical protein KC478_04910 [Bacteriovoracaceae bacterium]|nr:hypothetical protein [Bacteriovoracaceae bacterium]
MNIVEYIKEHSELVGADELVFFAGSFNPWHPGHTSCVELLPPNKQLIVAPDHNPFKELVDKKHCDVEAITAQIQGTGRQSFIFDGFLDANVKNPTANWIKALKEAFPDKELSLLIGFDSYASIDRWTNAQELLSNLSSLYVASRKDDPTLKEQQLERLRQMSPKLRIDFLGTHPHEELSSTQIRSELNS